MKSGNQKNKNISRKACPGPPRPWIPAFAGMTDPGTQRRKGNTDCHFDRREKSFLDRLHYAW
jgi:hypothetical protein